MISVITDEKGGEILPASSQGNHEAQLSDDPSLNFGISCAFPFPRDEDRQDLLFPLSMAEKQISK